MELILNQLLPRIKEELKQSLEAGALNSFGSESYVIEVYSLELSFYYRNGSLYKRQVKRCYDKIVDACTKTAVQDPRLMGYVHEIGAKLDMEENRWTLAYGKFLEAFRNYQEAGNQRAKQILKYVMLANMIALKDINPFGTAGSLLCPGLFTMFWNFCRFPRSKGVSRRYRSKADGTAERSLR